MKNPLNKDGQPHGLCEEYWDNGSLLYKGTYVNIYYKGTYVNGKEYGLWEYYNKDGTIMKQIFYSKHLYEQD